MSKVFTIYFLYHFVRLSTRDKVISSRERGYSPSSFFIKARGKYDLVLQKIIAKSIIKA